ncbi:unnamed protein product [Urochloa humidicola]
MPPWWLSSCWCQRAWGGGGGTGVGEGRREEARREVESAAVQREGELRRRILRGRTRRRGRDDAAPLSSVWSAAAGLNCSHPNRDPQPPPTRPGSTVAALDLLGLSHRRGRPERSGCPAPWWRPPPPHRGRGAWRSAGRRGSIPPAAGRSASPVVDATGQSTTPPRARCKSAAHRRPQSRGAGQAGYGSASLGRTGPPLSLIPARRPTLLRLHQDLRAAGQPCPPARPPGGSPASVGSSRQQ